MKEEHGLIAEQFADFLAAVAENLKELIVGVEEAVAGIVGKLGKAAEDDLIEGFQLGILGLEGFDALPQPLVQLAGFGDVDDDAHDGVAAFVGNGAPAPVEHPGIGAVLFAHPVGDFVAVGMAEGFGDDLGHARPVVRVDGVVDHASGFLDEFVIGVAEVLQKLIIDEVEGEAVFDVAADEPARKAGLKQLKGAAPRARRGGLPALAQKHGGEVFALALRAARQRGVHGPDAAFPVRLHHAHGGKAHIKAVRAAIGQAAVDPEIAFHVAGGFAERHGAQVAQGKPVALGIVLKLLAQDVEVVPEPLSGPLEGSGADPAHVVGHAAGDGVQIAFAQVGIVKTADHIRGFGDD